MNEDQFGKVMDMINEGFDRADALQAEGRARLAEVVRWTLNDAEASLLEALEFGAMAAMAAQKLDVSEAEATELAKTLSEESEAE